MKTEKEILNIRERKIRIGFYTFFHHIGSDKVITNNTIYYHYRYLPRHHDIDSQVPTFTYKKPYCENRGNSWHCTFHYWSKNGKLQEKDLMDMYTKWCMEQLEEEGIKDDKMVKYN
jgi:hypothetical protein